MAWMSKNAIYIYTYFFMYAQPFCWLRMHTSLTCTMNKNQSLVISKKQKQKKKREKRFGCSIKCNLFSSFVRTVLEFSAKFCVETVWEQQRQTTKRRLIWQIEEKKNSNRISFQFVLNMFLMVSSNRFRAMIFLIFSGILNLWWCLIAFTNLLSVSFCQVARTTDFLPSAWFAENCFFAHSVWRFDVKSASLLVYHYMHIYVTILSPMHHVPIGWAVS